MSDSSRILTGDATLYLGDCLDVLPTLDADSIDAVVTDPPYGLSFMGKAWDKGVPSVEVWREVLRVLKPGGHLLAFAGTRTQHRMASAIEDAGFEIRDMIAWVYGSGFPKSLDVSKAIDKMDAVQEQQARRYRFTEWVRSQGVTSAQIDEATGTNMGGHYTTAASQPAIMTREHLEVCRHLFADVPKWVEREADIRSVESKQFAEREVVGKHSTDMGGLGGERLGQAGGYITTPATPEAQQWDGWGTALKPALEPITVARKPLTGTVAANVLQHGTGAINVDGCRVGTEKVTSLPSHNANNHHYAQDEWTKAQPIGEKKTNVGRFPANLIHDGSDEVVRLFPERKGAVSNGSKGTTGKNGIYNVGWGAVPQKPGRGDSGSAARFFYQAKCSKRDRNEGLPEGTTSTHPTVKPTALMRYLCRLVTPPGGVVLDPYMGSGSTGKAAMYEGFCFIGIELAPDYMEIAKARIEHAVKPVMQPDIFGDY